MLYILCHLSILYEKECVDPSVLNAKCVVKLKGYFLRSEVGR